MNGLLSYIRLSARSVRAFAVYLVGGPGGTEDNPVFISTFPEALTNPQNQGWFNDFLVNGAPTQSPSTVIYPGNLRSEAVGTGSGLSESANGVNVANKAHGVNRMATGTTTTGWTAISSGQGGVMLGIGRTELGCRLFFSGPGVANDDFFFDFGYHDTLNGTTKNPIDGAFFRYDRAVDGAFWTCITADLSDSDPTNPTNTTKTVTAVPVKASATVTDVMQRLVILVNDDASAISFYIDDVLVATHTTNTPQIRNMGLGARIAKVNGTTSFTAYLDYIYEQYSLAR